ncbi:MAG: class I tRNA ligase family protein, partial [Lawsonibacter sp.]|nr:class I tRNA ligase family protein [Lawsonibacter sp.]
ASMQKDQGFWPATVYMEGLDQYRGWFQSSLLTAVGALGKGAPFKECVTHGWTVDGEGKAMHKSLGNGVDPADIFKKYGADLIRLWAGSADYHVDVRCSDNIFKQLSQNYLKFRNTARYCLGNLDGFDPNNLVKPEEMVELDRWAVTKLNGLIEKCFAAYDNFEFHVVSHAINDFCVVELSSFYLDIIKDRLYCEEKDGLLRRSAQTALWMILDTMTKLFAPILAFTCDEIWLAMPHREGDDPRNVLLNEMNKPFAEYALEEDAMSAWSGLIDVRNAVNVALEQARNEKKIGKSLEAKVTIPSNRIAGSQLIGMDELADLLIVSQVEVSSDVTDIQVEPAAGAKCERCWKVLPTVGADSKHPTLCPRCARVVAKSISFEAL